MTELDEPEPTWETPAQVEEKKEKRAKHAVDAELVGGPRDGETLRLVNPPPASLRLIDPERIGVWCTYVSTADGRRLPNDAVVRFEVVA